MLLRLTVALLLVGCASPDRQADPSAGADSAAPAPSPAPLPADTPPAAARPGGSGDTAAPAPPATKQARLPIEGMQEPITLRLYEAPAGFPLRFATYLPAGLQPEAAGSGAEGEAVRSVAAFGGRRNEQAQLRLVVLPAGTDGEQARRAARRAAEGLGGVPLELPQYPWAQASYRLRGERSGWLSLGEQGGRWFYLLAHYPPEYAEGFGPRAEVVLREWRWAKGGGRLAG